MDNSLNSSTTNIELAISELHKAFHKFNEYLFSNMLPEPAILIQNRGNKKNVLGWCSTQQIWVNEVAQDFRYEINIVAESLNRQLPEILSTLLHEMIHLHNLVNNIKDTSRGNVYHNKRFKEVAESHGLVITHNEKIGWSMSKLSDNTLALIETFGISKAAFNLCRRDTNGAKAKSSSRKYVCPKCGTIARSSKEINVICGICKVPFVLEA